MIEIKNVSFEYQSAIEGEEALLAVDDVSFCVREGEFVAVLGRNGSGKSTLAKIMNGLIMPTKGDCLIDGKNTKDPSDIWEIRRTAGMVFQNPDNQLVATIVEEDVAFGPENLGIPNPELRNRVDDALEKVGMTEYKRHAPHLLSGGQKQRVAIAGILAMNPSCIILDEPTAMLDPNGRKEVIETVKKLNKNEKKTIVLITHFMEEAVQADRILIMSEGKLVRSGTPWEIFSDVKGIKELGLDIPQVTELAYMLYSSGLKIDSEVLNIEDLVNLL